jgi:hypothetical protein
MGCSNKKNTLAQEKPSLFTCSFPPFFAACLFYTPSLFDGATYNQNRTSLIISLINLPSWQPTLTITHRVLVTQYDWYFFFFGGTGV